MKEATSVDMSDRTVSCTHEGCTKTFKNNTLMHKHLMIHGPKNHKCDECGKSFAINSYLTLHMRVHKREFQCTYKGCGHSFTCDSKLKQHEMVHSGERPHVCNVKDCNKAFAQARYLNKHLLTHTKKTLAAKIDSSKKGKKDTKTKLVTGSPKKKQVIKVKYNSEQKTSDKKNNKGKTRPTFKTKSKTDSKKTSIKKTVKPKPNKKELPKPSDKGEPRTKKNCSEKKKIVIKKAKKEQQTSSDIAMKGPKTTKKSCLKRKLDEPTDTECVPNKKSKISKEETKTPSKVTFVDTPIEFHYGDDEEYGIEYHDGDDIKSGNNSYEKGTDSDESCESVNSLDYDDVPPIKYTQHDRKVKSPIVEQSSNDSLPLSSVVNSVQKRITMLEPEENEQESERDEDQHSEEGSDVSEGEELQKEGDSEEEDIHKEGDSEEEDIHKEGDSEEEEVKGKEGDCDEEELDHNAEDSEEDSEKPDEKNKEKTKEDDIPEEEIEEEKNKNFEKDENENLEEETEKEVDHSESSTDSVDEDQTLDSSSGPRSPSVSPSPKLHQNVEAEQSKAVSDEDSDPIETISISSSLDSESKQRRPVKVEKNKNKPRRSLAENFSVKKKPDESIPELSDGTSLSSDSLENSPSTPIEDDLYLSSPSSVAPQAKIIPKDNLVEKKPKLAEKKDVSNDFFNMENYKNSSLSNIPFKLKDCYVSLQKLGTASSPSKCGSSDMLNETGQPDWKKDSFFAKLRLTGSPRNIHFSTNKEAVLAGTQISASSLNRNTNTKPEEPLNQLKEEEKLGVIDDKQVTEMKTPDVKINKSESGKKTSRNEKSTVKVENTLNTLTPSKGTQISASSLNRNTNTKPEEHLNQLKEEEKLGVIDDKQVTEMKTPDVKINKSESGKKTSRNEKSTVKVENTLNTLTPSKEKKKITLSSTKIDETAKKSNKSEKLNQQGGVCQNPPLSASSGTQISASSLNRNTNTKPEEPLNQLKEEEKLGVIDDKQVTEMKTPDVKINKSESAKKTSRNEKSTVKVENTLNTLTPSKEKKKITLSSTKIDETAKKSNKSEILNQQGGVCQNPPLSASSEKKKTTIYSTKIDKLVEKSSTNEQPNLQDEVCQKIPLSASSDKNRITLSSTKIDETAKKSNKSEKLSQQGGERKNPPLSASSEKKKTTIVKKSSTNEQPNLQDEVCQKIPLSASSDKNRITHSSTKIDEKAKKSNKSEKLSQQGGVRQNPPLSASSEKKKTTIVKKSSTNEQPNLQDEVCQKIPLSASSEKRKPIVISFDEKKEDSSNEAKTLKNPNQQIDRPINKPLTTETKPLSPSTKGVGVRTSLKLKQKSTPPNHDAQPNKSSSSIELRRECEFHHSNYHSQKFNNYQSNSEDDIIAAINRFIGEDELFSTRQIKATFEHTGGNTFEREELGEIGMTEFDPILQNVHFAGTDVVNDNILESASDLNFEGLIKNCSITLVDMEKSSPFNLEKPFFSHSKVANPSFAKDSLDNNQKSSGSASSTKSRPKLSRAMILNKKNIKPKLSKTNYCVPNFNNTMENVVENSVTLSPTLTPPFVTNAPQFARPRPKIDASRQKPTFEQRVKPVENSFTPSSNELFAIPRPQKVPIRKKITFESKGKLVETSVIPSSKEPYARPIVPTTNPTVPSGEDNASECAVSIFADPSLIEDIERVVRPNKFVYRSDDDDDDEDEEEEEEEFVRRPSNRRQIETVQEPEKSPLKQLPIEFVEEPVRCGLVEILPPRSPDEPPTYTVQSWLDYNISPDLNLDETRDLSCERSCIEGYCIQYLRTSVDLRDVHNCTGEHSVPSLKILERLISEDETLTDQIIKKDFINPKEAFLQSILMLCVRFEKRHCLIRLGQALKNIDDPAVFSPLWGIFVNVWFRCAKFKTSMLNPALNEILSNVFFETPLEDRHTKAIQIILQKIADVAVELPSRVKTLTCVEFLALRGFPKALYPECFKLACFVQVNATEGDSSKFGFKAFKTLVDTNDIHEMKKLYDRSPTVVEEFLTNQHQYNLLNAVKNEQRSDVSLAASSTIFTPDVLVRKTQINPEEASRWLFQFSLKRLPLKRIFDTFERNQAGRRIYQTLISCANAQLRQTLAPVTFEFLSVEASKRNWESSYELYKLFSNFDPTTIQDLNRPTLPASKALLVIKVCLALNEIREALDLFIRFKFTNANVSTWALRSCPEDRTTWNELCQNIKETLEQSFSVISTAFLYSFFHDLSMSQNSFSGPIDLEMGLSSLLTQLVMEEKLDLAVDFTIKAYNLGMSDSLYYSVDTFTYRILIVETVKAGSDAFFPLLKSASLHTSTYDANLQFDSETLSLGTNLEPEEIYAVLIFKFWTIQKRLSTPCFRFCINYEKSENKEMMEKKYLPCKDFSLRAAHTRFLAVLDHPHLSRFKTCFVLKGDSMVWLDPTTYNYGRRI